MEQKSKSSSNSTASKGLSKSSEYLKQGAKSSALQHQHQHTSRQEHENESQIVKNDPIKSIANVLNKHHKELERAGVSGKQSKKIVQTASRASNKQSSGEKVVKKNSSKASSSSSGESKKSSLSAAAAAAATTTITNNNNSSRQELEQKLLQQVDDFSKQTAKKHSHLHLQTKQRTVPVAAAANQVDQGNSYLYAYNDFIQAPRQQPEHAAESGFIQHQRPLGFVACEHFPGPIQRDLDEEDLSDSEDEEEHEALSHILIQQQQQQQHSSLLDNHLRRYLQIEENFNTFKAARHQQQASLWRQQQAIQQGLIVGGGRPQAPNCFVLSTSNNNNNNFIINQDELEDEQQLQEDCLEENEREFLRFQEKVFNNGKSDNSIYTTTAAAATNERQNIFTQHNWPQTSNHATTTTTTTTAAAADQQQHFWQQNNATSGIQTPAGTQAKATSCGNFLVFVPAHQAAIQSANQHQPNTETSLLNLVGLGGGSSSLGLHQPLVSEQEAAKAENRAKNKLRRKLPLIKNLARNNNSNKNHHHHQHSNSGGAGKKRTTKTIEEDKSLLTSASSQISATNNHLLLFSNLRNALSSSGGVGGLAKSTNLPSNTESCAQLDMYAPNGGQPGAYYVAASSSDSSQGNDQNLHHHDLHLHHHQLHSQQAKHLASSSAIINANHQLSGQTSVNNNINNSNHYQSSSSADSSLGSSGAFANPNEDSRSHHNHHHNHHHTTRAHHQHPNNLHNQQHRHQHLHNSRSNNHPHHHHHHHHNHDSSFLANDNYLRRIFACSWLGDFCSKKCLFITCIISLLFIFILVISLSAYLNFLITASKTNLQPLSGRLRYDLLSPSPTIEINTSNSNNDSLTNLSAQQMQLLFSNKTSKEFLLKQQQFETILRGALDRTQALLKTYPNHLVKLEVYSFKPHQQTTTTATTLANLQPALPTALWVYFRLFVNKRTIQQDSMLMKRKSPDEMFDKQFLPRLTQQTLHSGFEQLISVFGTPNSRSGRESESTIVAAASSSGGDSSESARRFNGQQQPTNNGHTTTSATSPESRRLAPRALSANGARNSQQQQLQQQQQLKSFDEQISRLMHLVEAIDLQSIQVTPEFDMQASSSSSPGGGQPQEPSIMSDNLRALQPIITTTTASPSSVMVATGPGRSAPASGKLLEDELRLARRPATTNSKPDLEGSNKQSGSELDANNNNNNNDSSANASTRKFTLQGYRGDTTSTTSKPSSTSSTSQRPQPKESLFLLNQQQKKRIQPMMNGNNNNSSSSPSSSSFAGSNTLRDIAQASGRLVQSAAPNESGHENKEQEKVVRLVSGQPVVSQNAHLNSALLSEHFRPTTNQSSSPSSSASSSSRSGTAQASPAMSIGSSIQKPSQDPHQPNGSTVVSVSRSRSSQAPPLSTSSSSTPSSIEELWNNALRAHNSTGGFNNGRRLITMTTIGGQQQAAISNNPPMQTPSNSSSGESNNVTLEIEVSDAIRAQMATPATTPSTSTTTPKSPKVSPHLKLAGSLVSASTTRGDNNSSSSSSGSAVLLNQELAANGRFNPNDQRQASIRSTSAVNATLPTQARTNGTSNNGIQKQKLKGSQRTSNSTLTANANQPTIRDSPQVPKSSTPKPRQQQKVKKVVASPARNNETSTTSASPTSINEHRQQASAHLQADHSPASTSGSMEVGSLQSGNSTSSGRTTTSSSSSNNNNPSFVNPKPTSTANNRTSNRSSTTTTSSTPAAELAHLPTLPTTIELTRSATTALPPRASTAALVPGAATATSGTTTTNNNSIDSPSLPGANNQPRANGSPQLTRQTQQEPAFVPASQQARPGTSSFSGQWKPLQSSTSTTSTTTTSTSNPIQAPPFSSANVDDFWLNTNRAQTLADSSSSTRARSKPGVALIIGTERLPPNVNIGQPSGSRSPFAMPQQQPVAGQFSNRFRAAQPVGNQQRFQNHHHHDFESHRTSRMRQQQQQQQQQQSLRSSGSNNNEASNESSTRSSSFVSSTSTTASSSLNADTGLLDGSPAGNSRIVDDFMITTTTSSDLGNDNAPRAVTLLPPLIVSSFQQQPAPSGSESLVPSFVAPPKRTRGPFAFETLLGGLVNENNALEENPTSSSTTLSSALANDQPASSFDVGAPNEPSEPFSSRAQRSPSIDHPAGRQVNTDKQQLATMNGKLLIRKKLFTGNSEDELSFSSTTNPIITSADAMAEGRLIVADSSPQRCQYFGCKAKNPSSNASTPLDEFICLNQTQICDDFIDCQDESDELDCVSLIRPSAEQNGQLSFSNGAGIIYLNRRGSLAPMCIDYYAPAINGEPINNASSANLLDGSSLATAGARLASFESSFLHHKRTNSAHDLEAIQMQQTSPDSARRHQELIRQINTIGQYACSLQSFSRLVSVKINHNDLVDSSNLIKTSKTFHRLGILSSSQKQQQQHQQNQSNGRSSSLGAQSSSPNSFRSGLSNYEVEISTGSECPSQRTVFVKCGHFECGQDSFSVMNPQSESGVSSFKSDSAERLVPSAAKKRLQTGAEVVSDFPWLVKLYWHDSLACHGYLIDESWLIAASQCFLSATTSINNNNNNNNNASALANVAEQQQQAQNKDDPSSWTAEISYEHYGNEDYKSIESNRRSVKDIHYNSPSRQRLGSGNGSGSTDAATAVESSFVLAKLERPVRFSPLNRPICLPQSKRKTVLSRLAQQRQQQQQQQQSSSTDHSLDLLDAKNYKDCVLATLGRQAANSSRTTTTTTINRNTQRPPTQQQDLVLNNVRLADKPWDCFETRAASQENNGDDRDNLSSKHFLCANQMNSLNVSPGSRGDDSHDNANDATGVLICSSHQTSARLRSRWTIVGVQSNKTPDGRKLKPDAHLFTRVSSQIDWIVDTTNPRSSFADTANDRFGRTDSSDSGNDNQYDPLLADVASRTDGHPNQGSTFSEVPVNSIAQKQNTCNWFRCSSGECLPWSRICDGLYDCSSHEDELDCHK